MYDPWHRQSQKTVGSTKTRYVYSGWQRIADYNGTSGALQRRYVYGTDLDEPLIIVTGSTPTFLHHDKMGSIVAVSNNSGAVANKNKFSPFGEITTLGGTTVGFTGQRYDSELGLYYFKRRYYSPKLGRFLQPDPIGYTGPDFNLYTYVGNSPVKYTDPLGLATVMKIDIGDLIRQLLDRLKGKGGNNPGGNPGGDPGGDPGGKGGNTGKGGGNGGQKGSGPGGTGGPGGPAGKPGGDGGEGGETPPKTPPTDPPDKPPTTPPNKTPTTPPGTPNDSGLPPSLKDWVLEPFKDYWDRYGPK